MGLSEIAQVFGVLNHAYCKSVEWVLIDSPANIDHSSEAFMNNVESAMSHRSLLSDKQMVFHVFYPCFLETEGLKNQHAEDLGLGLPARYEDVRTITLPKSSVKDCNVQESQPSRSPYIVSVVVAYLRSLLRMHLDPHMVLQCFGFDICIYYHQEHILQQLLHYHVFIDSRELVLRLKEVSIEGGCRWAAQACLDMALRSQDYTVVADMLLHTRQYLDIVLFVSTKQVGEFKLRRLLEQIDADAEAQADDPDLVGHILSEIRLWKDNAVSSSRVAPPDLKDCERWLPDLF